MRGARFLLAVCATLALAGCVHEQYAQQASPRAAAPAPPARHLYSTSPAYAQQAYEQPAYQMVEVQPASADDRGLFNSRTAAPVYTAPAPAAARNRPRWVDLMLPRPPVTPPRQRPSLWRAVSERPYTFDAGDKLRVVVFGQDGITNSYTVDAGGKVNLPLIGAVTARGLTTSNSRTRSPRGSSKVLCASRM